jgi:hypothetical protein
MRFTNTRFAKGWEIEREIEREREREREFFTWRSKTISFFGGRRQRR